VLLYKVSVVDRKIIFNYKNVFLFGLSFYCVTPMFVGEFDLFASGPMMTEWHAIYARIPSINLIYYYILLISWIISYLLGGKMGESIVVRKINNLNLIKLKSLFIILLILMFCLFGYYYVIFKMSHQGDYTDLAPDDASKGPLSATYLVYFILATMYGNFSPRHGRDVGGRYIWVILYLVMSVLLLSLGGRLYVITCMTTLLFYRTDYFRGIGITKFSTLLFGGLFLVALIGVMRSNSALNFDNSIMMFFGESIYTGFSLISYLEGPWAIIFNLPIITLISFVNLIPTFLFPGKGQLFLLNTVLSSSVYAPLGATNIVTSLLLDMGWGGSIIFWFGLGGWMGYNHKRRTNWINRIIYWFSCSVIAFSLFRDSLAISLVKMLIEFGFIIPALVYIFLTHRSSINKLYLRSIS
jgi:hypothetical protein